MTDDNWSHEETDYPLHAGRLIRGTQALDWA
jgi:hypothetical protein